MKIKKTSWHNGRLITDESPTTSAKALNTEHFNKQVFQKCSMSKQEKEREKKIFLAVSYNHQL